MTLLRSDQVVRGNVDSSRATAGCAATRAAAGRRGNAAWRVRAAADKHLKLRAAVVAESAFFA